jgi:hypothetical protein
MKQTKGGILKSSRGYLFRITVEGKQKSVGGWQRTRKEAVAVQKNFLEGREKSGVDSFDVYSTALVRSARDAFIILQEAGIDDPRHLVDATRLYLKQSPVLQTKMTFNEAFDKMEACDRFLELSDKHRDAYRRYARYLTENLPNGWKTPLNEITTDHILATKEECLKTSRNEAFKCQKHLSYIFDAFFKNELRLVEITPFDRIPAVRKPKDIEKKELYTPEEAFRIFAYAVNAEQKRPWRALGLFIKAYTGMHSEELANITFDMFGKGGEMRFKETDAFEINIPAEYMKSRQLHSYPIPNILKRLLLSSPWFLKHFNMIDPKNPLEGLKVKSRYKDRKLFGYTSRKISDWMKQWCEACGVEWRGNLFRHMVASYGYKELWNENLSKTQEAIGHSIGTDTTFKYYKSKVTGASAKKYYNADNFTQEFMDVWCSIEGEEVYRTDKHEFDTVKIKYVDKVRREVNNTLSFGVSERLMINKDRIPTKKTKKAKSKLLFGMGF